MPEDPPLPEELYCREGLASRLTSLTLWSLLVLVGGTLVRWPEMRIQFLGLGLFLLGAAGFFHTLRSAPWRSAGIIVDARGIEDRRSPIGRVPWEAIHQIWTDERKGQPLLCLEVDATHLTSEAPAGQSAKVAIQFRGMRPGRSRVISWIKAHYSEKVRPQPEAQGD